MQHKEKPTGKETSPFETAYFEIQASWGMTKHIGGLSATKKLAELCHIDKDKYVLVVGCGIGVTACYLSEKHNCTVVGIDLSEHMVRRASERARKKNVTDKVTFRTADAQCLPFEDSSFDVVTCESVNAFISDKAKAMNEYVRVIKEGGYVGINEVTWLQKPPQDLVAYFYKIMGAEFLTCNDGWRELLEDAGLREMQIEIHKTNLVSQWVSEVRQFDLSDFAGAWFSYFSLFFKSASCRRFTKEALSFPRSIFNLFKYFGYGLYVGKK